MSIIETDGDLIDDIIEKNIHNEICERFNKLHSITNYAVTCDGKLLCFTGSDIIDAHNIRSFLRKKYPNRKFNISEEFMEFS